MNDAEALRMARALIATPEQWTRHVWARNKHGVPVRTESPNAVKFCALGALCRVGNSERAGDLLASASVELFGDSIVTVNDHRAHADVLRAYDRAIERAEQEAS